MGLNRAYIGYIEKCARDTIGGLQGKRMLELGNQHIRDEAIAEKTGKEYYINRVIEHISVDLNGSDGALMVDLSQPIKFANWYGYFDIITNAGTSEHVGLPKKNQYQCFMNIHNCLKVGGIAVHLVPDIYELKDKGCWKSHCNYYYSREFFRMLAEINNYRLISTDRINDLLCICLQKEKEVPFMRNRTKFLKYITRKGLPKISQGINDRGIYRFIHLAYCLVRPFYRLIKKVLKKN